MRYRPFGQAGISVSTICLVIDDRAAGRGPEALSELVYAAMEAGVNAFHIESCEQKVLEAVGKCLTAIERQLVFVSVRLGLRPGRTGLTRDFSPESLTATIDAALLHTGLGHLDLALLDEPGEDEFPTAALTALKLQRTTGRVSLLGVSGANDAMDVYIGTRAFNVLATPYHLCSGWKEQSRMNTAARMDMGVIAYDYFPENFRDKETTPWTPKKRSLLDALRGEPAHHPLAGAGTYSFLHNQRGWTAEELCLAYALMQPNVSTALIRVHDIERLNALATVPDRDIPAGMAAQVEMARFGRTG